MAEKIEGKPEIRKEKGIEEMIKEAKDETEKAIGKLAEATSTTPREEWEPDFRKFLEGSKQIEGSANKLFERGMKLKELGKEEEAKKNFRELSSIAFDLISSERKLVEIIKTVGLPQKLKEMEEKVTADTKTFIPLLDRTGDRGCSFDALLLMRGAMADEEIEILRTMPEEREEREKVMKKLKEIEKKWFDWRKEAGKSEE